jgi:NAD(P)-dependent dehydrogenase (short-subunit alcohol dehydrogenase family)
VGTARDPEAALARIRRETGADAPFRLVALDLADPAAVERGWEEALARLGGVDVLVNNAGAGELGSVEDTDLADSRRLFEVNYFGPVALVKKAVPAMRARGAGVIVNLGSIVHDLQFPFKAQYCASKSALTGFSLSLRYELHPYGIRVHVLEPGWVRSAFHERLKPVFREGSPYAARLKPFLDYSRDRDPRIIDGAGVAAVIRRAIEDPQTPVRVAVGGEARKFRVARRLLSNAMLDRLLLWKLSKKGEML